MIRLYSGIWWEGTSVSDFFKASTRRDFHYYNLSASLQSGRVVSPDQIISDVDQPRPSPLLSDCQSTGTCSRAVERQQNSAKFKENIFISLNGIVVKTVP